jgi:GPI-GlcNAc transferase complex PIG-U subunit
MDAVGSPAGGTSETALLLREWLGAVRRILRDRRLLAILAAGMGLRLVLAPLTAWWLDTPALAHAAISVWTQGTPYFPNMLGEPMIDPPLGVLFSSLLVGPLALFVPFGAMILPIAGHSAAALASGDVPRVLPIPAFLLLQKLPPIMADGAIGLALFALVEGRTGSSRLAALAAIAWLLNPLVIWSSSIAGHFDSLAALLVLLALLFLVRRNFWMAGLCLGLGTAVKLYPVLLVPLAVVIIVVRRKGASDSAVQSRLSADRPVGGAIRLVLGTVVGSLPALVYLPTLLALYGPSGPVRTQSFSGFTPWLFSNAVLLERLGSSGPLYASPTLPELLLPLAVAVIGSALLLVFRRREAGAASDPLGSGGWAILWVLTGAVLSYQAPVPENLLALLPLLLLVSPNSPRVGLSVYLTLSGSGFAFVVSQLGFAAFFYPLAAWIGPAAVASLDRQVLAYVSLSGWDSGIGFSVVAEVIGVAALLLLFVLAPLVLERRLRREPGPPAQVRASDAATGNPGESLGRGEPPSSGPGSSMKIEIPHLGPGGGCD